MARQGQRILKKRSKKAMGKLYLGGIPISIDVQKMKDAFGVPKKGDYILYTDISEVIGI